MTRPLWASPVSKAEMTAGDGADSIAFIQAHCRVTKTSIGGRAGELIQLREFQQRETYRILARDPATGARKHRAGLLGVGRKNGKSAWASGIGLWAADGSDPGAEIYICASSREQAGIVFNSCKRMLLMDPYLSRRFKPYKNELVIPDSDIKIVVLSAEASTKDGFDPTLVIFDEVHAQPNDELWDAMALGMGARIDPLIIGITTAGKLTDRFGKDTLCYRLFQYGIKLAKGEIVDPTFYFTWWGQRTNNVNHLDPKVWAAANPGLGDLVSEADLASVARRTDEASFKTKRCNMWVTGKISALPSGAWEGRAIPKEKRVSPSDQYLLTGEFGTPSWREVPAEWLSDSVLFLDGSWSGDSTGVVGCTRNGLLFVVSAYEKPESAGPDWRVPVNAVLADIRAAFLFGARLLVLDPYRWQQSAADLRDDGLPVAEWATGSLARIIPAWKDYFAAVQDGGLRHDGDPALARHHDNMVLKQDARGTRPVKDAPMSTRHIDLAICAIGAFTLRGLELEAEAPARKPWVM